MNIWAFCLSPSISTNKNTTLPFPLNLSFKIWIEGISALHGGHQVAQKLRKTTLPFRSDTLTVFPSLFRKVTSGAVWPTADGVWEPSFGCSESGWNNPLFMRPLCNHN